MDKKIFENGLNILNLNIDEEKIKKFEVFSTLLKEENEKMNLTAITDDKGISCKHFLDSILPLSVIDIKENAKILDIGTGAGFPGIPLKIMREDFNITLLDSLNKRIMFLKKVRESLNLSDCELIHDRAEILGKNKDYRERFDFVFSRAVASLKVLSEYSLPFLKVGGAFYALKAENIDEEIEDAKPLIGNIGGKIEDIIEINIPETDIKRKIIKISKIKNTPPQFPRNNKKIKG